MTKGITPEMRYAVAAVMWEPRGWAVMRVTREGSISVERGMTEVDARAALVASAELVSMQVWSKKRNRLVHVLDDGDPTIPRRADRRGVLPVDTRFEVFQRDGHRCVYCGRSAPDVPLHVDHRVPVSRGGTDDPANLVTSCRDCNLGKSNRPLKSA